MTSPALGRSHQGWDPSRGPTTLESHYPKTNPFPRASTGFISPDAFLASQTSLSSHPMDDSRGPVPSWVHPSSRCPRVSPACSRPDLAEPFPACPGGAFSFSPNPRLPRALDAGSWILDWGGGSSGRSPGSSPASKDCSKLFPWLGKDKTEEFWVLGVTSRENSRHPPPARSCSSSPRSGG